MTPTKALSRAELASKYGVHVTTLYRYLKRAGIEFSRYQKILMPADLEKIKAALGPWE